MGEERRRSPLLCGIVYMSGTATYVRRKRLSTSNAGSAFSLEATIPEGQERARQNVVVAECGKDGANMLSQLPVLFYR